MRILLAQNDGTIHDDIKFEVASLLKPLGRAQLLLDIENAAFRGIVASECNRIGAELVAWRRSRNDADRHLLVVLAKVENNDRTQWVTWKCNLSAGGLHLGNYFFDKDDNGEAAAWADYDNR